MMKGSKCELLFCQFSINLYFTLNLTVSSQSDKKETEMQRNIHSDMNVR